MFTKTHLASQILIIKMVYIQLHQSHKAILLASHDIQVGKNSTPTKPKLVNLHTTPRTLKQPLTEGSASVYRDHTSPVSYGKHKYFTLILPVEAISPDTRLGGLPAAKWCPDTICECELGKISVIFCMKNRSRLVHPSPASVRCMSTSWGSVRLRHHCDVGPSTINLRCLPPTVYWWIAYEFRSTLATYCYFYYRVLPWQW